MSRIACVVIGRNEAPRLERCLRSVLAETDRVVFVDSASTDESVAIAERCGVPTLALDPALGLSAARARNAGFRRILEEAPETDYVQFVDGDCELLPGWIEAGARALDAAPQTAAVFGRLRERHREATIYNTLCDMEWQAPPGEVAWSGGIALVRTRAFEEAGGFDPTLIAGEEPDLCTRWAGLGYTILSLDRDMALHDAAMTDWRQWWRRNVRAGYAYAEALARRPARPAMDARRHVKSIALWGLATPAASLLLLPPTLGASLPLSVLGYSALGVRVGRHMRQRGFSGRDSALYAAFCVLGKFPQAAGLVRFLRLRLQGRASALIEHRGAR
jgi:GT2 family glycosyltransferase